MLAKGPATARAVQHNVLVGRPIYINLVGKLHYLPSERDFQQCLSYGISKQTFVCVYL